jgi:hypothetical protein
MISGTMMMMSSSSSFLGAGLLVSLLLVSHVSVIEAKLEGPTAAPSETEGLIEQIGGVINDIVDGMSRPSKNESTAPPSVAPDFDASLGLDAEDACIFCDTKDEFDSELTFAGISCEEWASLALFAPPGEQCVVLRAAAVQFCECPATTEETCNLCPNGVDGFQANQELLIINNLTCSDIVNMPAVDGEETCSFVQQKFSYLCGCPGVAPSCSLCGQDEDGNQLVMTNGDEVLIPGNPNTNEPDVTCSIWDKLLSVDFTSLQADESIVALTGRTAGGTSSCEESVGVAQGATGIQLSGLCGCPGVEAANNCSTCPDGMVLVDGREDCKRIGFVAPFITSASKCQLMQTGAEQVGCCIDNSDAPEIPNLGEITSSPQTPVSLTGEESGASSHSWWGVMVSTAAFLVVAVVAI